jgi:hypothetical protein
MHQFGNAIHTAGIRTLREAERSDSTLYDLVCGARFKFLSLSIWVSPRIPSIKLGRLNSYHETSSEIQANNITVINTLNTCIL